MSTSFKRHDVQEYIEYQLNCFDINNWTSYKQSLINFQIDSTQELEISNCIGSDIQSYYFKSVFTFIQALNNIKRNYFNWAIVQLYYSCFYAIRCDILLSNHIIVRCSGLYLAENFAGNSFSPFTLNKVRGDHQMSIELLKKLKNEHKIIDEILDNNLDDDDAYTWMMKQREKVNYQIKDFHDPNPSNPVDHVYSYFKDDQVFDLLKFYNESDYSICFDLQHSIVSIPFKKIKQIQKKIESSHNIDIKLNIEKVQFMKKNLKHVGITFDEFKSLI